MGFISTGNVYLAPLNSTGSSTMVPVTSWTFTFNNVPTATYAVLTGQKLKRGWNGKSQARCSGCGRWAKLVPESANILVECSRCLGQWPRA